MTSPSPNMLSFSTVAMSALDDLTHAFLLNTKGMLFSFSSSSVASLSISITITRNFFRNAFARASSYPVL